MEEPAADPQVVPYRHAVARARLPLAVGLTVTGAVLVGGYLMGLVQGPLIAVTGGFALMTFGRGLGRARSETALLCAAFAVLLGAWIVPAMRWSTLVVDDLRGAQGVLGPTLLVGSREIVWGTGLAAGASVLALAVWAASPPVGGRAAWVRGIEAIPIGLVTMTAFWGPAVAGDPAALGGWVLGVALLALVATGGAAALRAGRARGIVLGAAGCLLLVGAGFVARGLQ